MDAAARARLAWTAHADAWQQQATVREQDGGAWVRLPGVRLMSSGLPHPWWNHADVVDAPLVDVEEVRAWYRTRGVPWGARVLTGTPWPHGRKVLAQQLMGQERAEFRPAPEVAGVSVRPATPEDLDQVLAVDAAAFGGDVQASRPWLAPMLRDARATVAFATDEIGPVGTGYAVSSDAEAGPAVYLGGIAVLGRARRRGIGSAVSSWLLARAYAAGARTACLQPDTGAAERVYGRLGLVPAGGFDVYVG